MKSLCLLLLLGLVSAKDPNVDLLTVYKDAKKKSDESGWVGKKDDNEGKPITTIEPLARGPPVKIKMPDLAATDCKLVFDIALVFDTTYSSADDLVTLVTILPPILHGIALDYPGSMFAVVSHRDKPIESEFLGWSNDYCGYTHQPMTGDMSAIDAVFASFYAAGGYDWPENQLEIIQHVALSPVAMWRSQADVAADEHLVKLIIEFTDSIYHVAGDSSLPDNDGDALLECTAEDYPYIDQVKNALKSQDIVPVFIVPTSHAVPGIDLKAVYEELNEFLIGEKAYVFARGSTDTEVAIKEMFKTITEKVCVELGCAKEEFVVSRDLSSSAADNWELYRQYLNNKFGAYVGSATTNFGLTSFSDRPVPFYGYPWSLDFCFYNHFSGFQTYDTFYQAFIDTEHPARSGADWPENQLDALIRSVKQYNWTARTDCRCVHLITDAAFHKAGDVPGKDPYDDSLLPDNTDCSKLDYPSMMQVKQAFMDSGVYCLHIYTSEWGDRFYKELKQVMESNSGIFVTIEATPDMNRRLGNSPSLRANKPQEFPSQNSVDLRGKAPEIRKLFPGLV